MIKRAFLATIPVMTGYIVLGLGYGVIMETKGFGFFWAVGMSVFLFAGSMQYAAIALFTGGASLLTTGLTTLAVNARHLFYGISMVNKYRDMKGKAFLIFALTDETYSLVCNDAALADMDKKQKNKYYLLVTLMDYLYWVAGTALGSLVGAVVHFDSAGIDFALTALFLTVFVEQWLTTRNHLAAIIGVAMSVICLLFFGAANFLIPAMILITVALTLMRRVKGIENEAGDDANGTGDDTNGTGGNENE